MSYYVKILIQSEYERKFSGVSDFIVIETKGITGNDNNQMRGRLLEKGIRLTVVKNSLMRRMLEARGQEKAAGLFASGPSTVVYGGDNVVDVAREVVEWAKTIKTLQLKGAYVDGSVVGAKGVEDLSKMPSRAELQGRIVSTALSPGARLAGAIVGPGSAIAGCLKTLIEKLEKEAA
jgi:large subunit ribosomal protein L10